MNRTIKDATVKRFYYDTHDQLRTHLGHFVTAYNFARRLKHRLDFISGSALASTEHLAGFVGRVTF